MLEQSCCLLFYELRYHIAEDGSNSIKPFIRSTDVVQAMIIEKNLLDNENSDCLAELRASFHYPKTQWNDFSCEKEVDNIRGIVFDKSTNNSQ
jgi:hypothetical protein